MKYPILFRERKKNISGTHYIMAVAVQGTNLYQVYGNYSYGEHNHKFQGIWESLDLTQPQHLSRQHQNAMLFSLDLIPKSFKRVNRLTALLLYGMITE